MDTDDLTDELLMAYADGELGEPGARGIEAAMLSDPATAARVVLFLRTRRLTRAAYAADAAAVPESLRRAVEESIRQAERPGPTAVVVPFEARREPPAQARPDARRPMARPWMAAAAAVALAVVGALGFLLLQPRGAPAGTGVAALAAPDVGRALSSAAAGEQVVLAAGTLRPVQTFEAADGALCREFELVEGTDVTSAVACRAGEAWRIRFAAIAPAAADGSYAPAGAPGLVDDFLTGIGAGGMMEPAAEAAALEAIR